MMDLNEILLAVEFGYIQCEKGHNLQYALEEARKIISRPPIERDFLEAVKTGHQNALTLWAREYDIRIPTGGNWKDRVRFATEQIKLRSNTMAKNKPEATKPAAKEAAKPETTKKKVEEKPAGPPMLGTKDIAEKLGIEGTTLRRFLRAKGIQKNEGRYVWKEGSKEAAALLKQYAEYAKELETKAEEAAKPKADKKKAKAGKKAAKKNADSEDEGLDDEGGEDEETEEL